MAARRRSHARPSHWPKHPNAYGATTTRMWMSSAHRGGCRPEHQLSNAARISPEVLSMLKWPWIVKGDRTYITGNPASPLEAIQGLVYFFPRVGHIVTTLYRLVSSCLVSLLASNLEVLSRHHEVRTLCRQLPVGVDLFGICCRSPSHSRAQPTGKTD